jgi:hypothetical protein
MYLEDRENPPKHRQLIYQSRRRHIPGERSRYRHCCENHILSIILFPPKVLSQHFWHHLMLLRLLSSISLLGATYSLSLTDHIGTALAILTCIREEFSFNLDENSEFPN